MLLNLDLEGIAASTGVVVALRLSPIEAHSSFVSEALDRLPPAKIHCSVLAEEALKSAIKDYLKRKKNKT